MYRLKPRLPLFLLTLLTPGLQASDHKEAPLIREDPTADLADVYAFLNPSDPDRLVLAMTVNPFSVPAEGVGFQFSPQARYRFNIDTNGDAKQDRTIDLEFQTQANGSQTFEATFFETTSGFVMQGDVTAPTEEPVANPPIINAGPMGVRVFAGPRDDPFFFDVVGFFRFLSGTGSFQGLDGFAGFNVSAIVVELPLELVDDGQPLQIWAETSRRKQTLRRSSAGKLELNLGPYQRVDRVGNPAVATALIPAARKDLFNIARPADDGANFAADIVASLVSLGTNNTNIGILASVAVPDTLKFDPRAAVGYPNGRTLEDDVIDTLLFFIFNQTPVADGVAANDRPFSAQFPFLADPWQPN